MADPVSVVGLISGVITFIDFGLKVISESKKLRDSASTGNSDEISELDHYITNIQQWHEKVKHQQLSGLQLSQSEKRILELVQDCEKLVIELREVVESLKMQVKARSKTFETARVAFQRRWKYGDIQNMRTRLHNLDEQIRSHVEHIMQADSNSAIMRKLKDLEASQDAENVRHISHMTQIRDDILSLSEKPQRDFQKWDSTQAARLTALGLKFDVLMKEQISCTYQLEVLKSLHFREIRKRWYGIKTADQMSNEWIYDSKKASFTSWLKSDAPGDGIFYITGKAGSGKSTLMKFIAEDSRTSTKLETWAHQCTLHQASYYFWNQGTEMQKSINGLFQSLLYQILRASPDLIQSVCERRLHHEPWTKEELYETFRRTEETRLTSKFCFFIDGLDEYEGDEGDITRLLEALSISGRIKICASSRPGRQYEHILRRQPDRMLDIVQFTQSDMHRHIHANLQRTTKWKDLERIHPDSCKQIVNEVSARANGVWLWVFLVTNDMVKEVNKNEGIDTLHVIVQRFPDDLHEYFETMIMRVPKLHRPDMARILLIAVEEVQPLPLYAFALLEKEKIDVDYVLKAPVEPIRKDETKQIYVALKDRIRNRCSDLLVVDDDQHPVFLNHSVDFLHRTVRDFLRDYDLKAHLTTGSFHPLVSLSRICLGLLKAVPVDNFRDSFTVNIIIGITDELLYYAREAELRCNADQYKPIIPILDEVEKVNSCHARGVRNHWTHARDSPNPRGADMYKEGGKCNFLALTVQSHLVEYVRAKLQADPGRLYKPGRPLLDYALRPRRVTPIGMPYHHIRDDPSICVEMIEMLLSPAIKADPNQQLPLYENRSVWTLFLTSIAESHKKSATSGYSTDASLNAAWYTVCQKLIEAGARWDGVKAAEASFNPSKSSAFAPILVHIFGYDQASNLTRTMSELEAAQGSKCNIM